MSDNSLFLVTLEESKFDDSQFMRINKGKMWICLSE